MFNGCKSLTTVTLSNTVSEIGTYAFNECISLFSIILPASLRTIRHNAFYHFTTLKSIVLNEGLETIAYDAFNGCTGLEAITIPSTVVKAESNIFRNCTGLLEATVNNAVVSEGMFRDCAALKKVVLSDKVKTIEGRGFSGCTSLQSLALPSGLTAIGNWAFSGCTGLGSITVPQSVTNVGSHAFYGCKALKTADIHSSIVSSYMFYGCTALTKVSMSDNVKSIGSTAFCGCSILADIIFGSSITQIGAEAFWDCEALKAVNVGANVELIGDSAFYSCSGLETVVIPASVKQLGQYAFASCGNLRNVSLVDGLATISYRAFYEDSNLKSIYIPASVVSIDSAFEKTGLGSGTVYCEKGSTADNADNYPTGTTIRYGRLTIASPKFVVKDIIGGKEITFNCDTKDAMIYYSTTKSTPTGADKSVANGAKEIFTNFYGTVYARAYCDGEWSEVSKLSLKIPVVNAPAITQSGNKVTIKTTTPNSTIYYTTDGSTPTVEKGIKGSGTSVSLDCFAGTLKAIAVKSGCTNSDMARKVLVNSARSRNVSFGVKGVFGGRNVTFGSDTKGAKIYYSATTSKLTTKDKCVDAGSTVLFEDFYGTVYARTYYNGEWGNVCRLVLKIPVVNTPTVSVDSKGYATIRTTTPKSRIYYTTDGTTPSMSNGKMASSSYVRVYVGKSGSGRIRAIAVRSCFTNSYECACTWKWTSY